MKFNIAKVCKKSIKYESFSRKGDWWIVNFMKSRRFLGEKLQIRFRWNVFFYVEISHWKILFSHFSIMHKVVGKDTIKVFEKCKILYIFSGFSSEICNRSTYSLKQTRFNRMKTSKLIRLFKTVPRRRFRKIIYKQYI